MPLSYPRGLGLLALACLALPPTSPRASEPSQAPPYQGSFTQSIAQVPISQVQPRISRPAPTHSTQGISPSAGLRPISRPANQASVPQKTFVGSIPRSDSYSTEVNRNPHPWQSKAGNNTNVQQVAFMQSGGATMPPGLEIPSLDAPTRVTDTPPATSLPPTNYGVTPQPSTPSSSPSVRTVPPTSNNFGQPATNSPGTLTPRATTSSPALAPPPSSLPPSNSPTFIPSSASDQTPVAPPQLPNQWATVGNCNLVSPPSTHQAGFWGCGPPVSAAGGNPYRLVPPTTMPNDPKAQAVYGDVGLKPLCNLCSTDGNVVLGQGILGQPKAYVAGQCFRNFVRYLTP